MQNVIKLLTLICITFATSNVDARWAPKYQDLSRQEQKVLTPISRDDLVDVLHDAYVVNYNKEPSDSRLSMAWAQIALENAEGNIVWNKNLGNIGPAFHKSFHWYVHSKLTIYRAFSSFQEAGQAYWSVIDKCQTAYRAFGREDAAESAHALKLCNYYGGLETEYTSMLSTLYWIAKQKLVPGMKERLRAKKLAREHELMHPYTSDCGCSKEDVVMSKV
jgi:hypothetical protein